MSNARTFFAGMGTSVLLLGAGFGGGLMLARTAVEPVTQNRATAADRLPSARVILPASAEPAPARLASSPVETLVATGVPTQQSQEGAEIARARDVQAQSQSTEREKQASMGYPPRGLFCLHRQSQLLHGWHLHLWKHQLRLAPRLSGHKRSSDRPCKGRASAVSVD